MIEQNIVSTVSKAVAKSTVEVRQLFGYPLREGCHFVLSQVQSRLSVLGHMLIADVL